MRRLLNEGIVAMQPFITSIKQGVKDGQDEEREEGVRHESPNNNTGKRTGGFGTDCMRQSGGQQAQGRHSSGHHNGPYSTDGTFPHGLGHA